MRSIDADALTNGLTELCNLNCPYTPKQREVMCDACLLGLALEKVEDAPTVETGDRINTNDHPWQVKECFKCGSKFCYSGELIFCSKCGKRLVKE